MCQTDAESKNGQYKVLKTKGSAGDLCGLDEKTKNANCSDKFCQIDLQIPLMLRPLSRTIQFPISSLTQKQ